MASRGGVRTTVARDVHDSHRAGGNHYALAVVALIRGVQVSPFPPLALVPNETPAAIPAGVSPCLRITRFVRGRDPTVPATVPGQSRDIPDEARRLGAALVHHVSRWGIFQTGAS
jgi:hypothetical protein